MKAKPALLSPAEYLAREENSPVKCEYVDGEIYAMSGAKRPHNLIAAKLVAQAVNAAAQHKDCHAFGSDMKVYVETHNSFYYPDLSVCCDPTDRNELFLVRPCFLVEVTSRSTASIDRREKRASYLTLESLREYAIVDQGRMHIELYRREGSVWRGYVLTEPDDIMESSCLDLRLDLRQVYAGVEFPPPGVAEPQAPQYTVAE